ncbi:Cytosolic non-specific dipeptidase [Tetrabaena socialis]|uniref:Cytosolic non-specific dipeptidase n=1 Tax=Tetrabaena socialis TaxID=47790 RepID=A0A2J8A4D5_9CHLO|nr:Cytosolic non-specific dipeptidase [Tetrabaena socialis]|eukprot:PNH07367.1 Cytosolic non-specific dipeptidase [Tetrabaena socialis]
MLRRMEAQAERYDTDLAELVGFASVSALPEHAADVEAAAEWLAGRLRRAGLQNVEVLPTDGPQPVVYGEWLAAAVHNGTTEAPTLLAVEAWLQETGALPLNVKFLLEGQEEVMSPHLPAFLRRHAAKLAATHAMSADGSQPGIDTGSISLGIRGVVGAQLEVTTASTDMHSGWKGGSVPNANAVLAALLAGLHDGATLAVAVEGFYDDVTPVTEQDRRDMEAYGFDAQQEAASLGLRGFAGEAGYGVLEQRWHRPTLEVVGMTGGFTGQGIKTVIPRQAMAKLNCRLLARHVEVHCPPYALCNLTALGGSAAPWTNARSSQSNAAAAAVHQRLSGRQALFVRDGATIPALAHFQQTLGLAATKFGWGLADRIHAPNERLRVEMYDKGRRAWALVLQELAAVAAAAAAPPGAGDGAGEGRDAGEARRRVEAHDQGRRARVLQDLARAVAESSGEGEGDGGGGGAVGMPRAGGAEAEGGAEVAEAGDGAAAAELGGGMAAKQKDEL